MNKKSPIRLILYAMASASLLTTAVHSSAATGEMGTGIPTYYGHYSAPLGGCTAIWILSSATINFPAGCNSLLLVRATMGADDYKLAMATMLTARITNKKIRFYAHAERDGGCGVDYVQMLD